MLEGGRNSLLEFAQEATLTSVPTSATEGQSKTEAWVRDVEVSIRSILFLWDITERNDTLGNGGLNVRVST